MRANLLKIVLTIVAVTATGLEYTAITAVASVPAAQGQAAASQQETTPAPQKARRRRSPRRGSQMMKGVPKGMDKCLAHLSEMAAKDPMTPYEGHPEEIVNNGLLWDDPKSKCSIGSDADLRRKVFDMATAWRMNDSAKVQSLLEEIKSAAPGQ